jgi:hypothetical protein
VYAEILNNTHRNVPRVERQPLNDPEGHYHADDADDVIDAGNPEPSIYVQDPESDTDPDHISDDERVMIMKIVSVCTHSDFFLFYRSCGSTMSKIPIGTSNTAILPKALPNAALMPRYFLTQIPLLTKIILTTCLSHRQKHHQKGIALSIRI